METLRACVAYENANQQCIQILHPLESGPAKSAHRTSDGTFGDVCRSLSR